MNSNSFTKFQFIKFLILAIVFLQSRTGLSAFYKIETISQESRESLNASELINKADTSGFGGVWQKYFTYQSLSPFRKKLIDEFISSEMPEGHSVEEYLNKQPGTRVTMRLSEALLFRNGRGDAETAGALLRWIFALQNQDRKSKDYGVWRGSPGEVVYADQNMREFIGTDLIIVYHKYRKLLPVDINESLKECLLYAAEGAFRRNVDPDYNNISIMSSFLMEYVGTEFNLPALKHAGLKKAKKIYTKYQKYNTLCEYNSPTYYGVDFVGLALWREMAFSDELRRMGRWLENALWLEVADFYNAYLRNICGPYLRSYGIDMNKYTAITGVWIAAAVDNPEIASVPCSAGSHNECNFIVPILDLGISMPLKAFNQFLQFDSSRFISRITSNYYEGDRLKKVTAAIQKDWMMGGLWGNRKVSRILITGTVHWKSFDGDIGWICVPGEGTTNIRVNEECMKIYLADRNARTFSVLAYSENSSPACFRTDRWTLSPMELGIETSLRYSEVTVLQPEIVRSILETPVYYPHLIRIVFEIPAGWNRKEPLVTITPAFSTNSLLQNEIK